jgi:O-antigen biosynthesis protein
MPTPAASLQPTIADLGGRPRVAGKFLEAGGRKLYVRGVTYGTFGSSGDGADYPSATVVERDFARMAENGLNAVRTYTVPPRRLLDAAVRHGLWVMVGLPWEQHVTFLDDRHRVASIMRRVSGGVRACAGHPAVLCYAVGNEIPAPIVRWHGRRRVGRYLGRLCEAVKSEDPDGLVTYVNFPSTEYLELPFLDLACFNVYLEAQKPLEDYLARLQNLAGERPLVMAEVGLDSRRNGEQEQARVLRWQVETVAAAGCAGAFVFAWTDEWHRGGHDIEDWDFGLTRRDRSPKPALEAVAEAFGEMPPRAEESWPGISVVVCSCNGARTLPDCLEGLAQLRYPNYEVIVVNDGSTDRTSAIAAEYPRFRLINTENQGLSAARNAGMRAATGQIVAYIDDDARPDPDWLTYLAHTFLTSSHVGVGGPNVAPPGDGPIADCVANAPGGPVHVLLSDREAEHIPGCNMAFRKSALEGVGGFDPRFRTAGDDVDLCWRLLDRGWTIGFNPAAMVWHHRRNSLRAYLKQQRGYGRAEALLERKWPAKYNAAGHLSWGGRLYGPGLLHPVRRPRWRVYHGMWGAGLFQRVYQPLPGMAVSMPLMPEWYLLVALLVALSAAGLLWHPLLLALPALGAAVATLCVQAVRGAASAKFPTPCPTWRRRLALRILTTGLYLAQPAARLWGRLSHGLTPIRRRGRGGLAPPRRRTLTHWSEDWESPEDRLGRVEARLLATGAPVKRGGHFDRWELQVRAGPLGRARLRAAVEEHGAGRQLVRFRVCPSYSPLLRGTSLALGPPALALLLAGSEVAAGVLLALLVTAAGRALYEGALACGVLTTAVDTRGVVIPAVALPGRLEETGSGMRVPGSAQIVAQHELDAPQPHTRGVRPALSGREPGA